MDEQKEFQTNSNPPQNQNLNNPIPAGIPADATFVVEPQVTEPVPDIVIPTLRTYKSDINQTVSRDKISTAKILIAEQNKQKTQDEKNSNTSITRPTNILVLILSIILITAAIGVIIYFGYTKVIKQTFTTEIKLPESFLFIFNKQEFIDVSVGYSQITQDVRVVLNNTNLKDGMYTEIVFYKNSQNTKEKERINSSEFLSLYGIKLPTNIARSISKDFVYGTYKINGKNEPFLVLGINDYETLYSSMLVWESTLALDIKDFFPVLNNLFDITNNKNNIQLQTTATTSSMGTTTGINSVSSTTSSSSTSTSSLQNQLQTTEEQQQTINRNIRFIDVVFSNKDARSVRDPNGNPFFYYSFIDNTKILFAQDPRLLNEITKKIKAKSLVR